MKNREAILNGIQAELDRIYHNATLGGSLRTESDFEEDIFSDIFELERNMAIEDAETEFSELVDMFGTLYQFGRGGRTLAFNDLIKGHGGSRYSVKTLEELGLDEIDTDKLERILILLNRFNDEVRSWCKSAPDYILRDIREEYAEEIKENRNKKRTTVTVYR
jgi:hypothetical protein